MFLFSIQLSFLRRSPDTACEASRHAAAGVAVCAEAAGASLAAAAHRTHRPIHSRLVASWRLMSRACACIDLNRRCAVDSEEQRMLEFLSWLKGLGFTPDKW
jgi:hypothetical protein